MWLMHVVLLVAVVVGEFEGFVEFVEFAVFEEFWGFVEFAVSAEFVEWLTWKSSIDVRHSF